MKKRVSVTLLAFSLSTMLAAPVHAASTEAGAYPNRPVRLIMGPGAGGPTDSVGRVLATRLTELWGQPVIVENRPGAGNTIATAAAAKATPDGYTLLLCPISDAVAPSLYKVNAGVVEALKTPDVQKRLENYGVDTSSSTPEQFAAFIRAETVRWAKVVKAAGIPQQ